MRSWIRGYLSFPCFAGRRDNRGRPYRTWHQCSLLVVKPGYIEFPIFSALVAPDSVLIGFIPLDEADAPLGLVKEVVRFVGYAGFFGFVADPRLVVHRAGDDFASDRFRLRLRPF